MQLFAESLESALSGGWRINVAYDLRGLAGVAATRGMIDAAARMLGAAEAVEEQVGEDIQSYARPIFAETTASVLARRDEPEIAAAWAEGRTMSEADAAAFALATVAERVPL